MYDTTGRLKNRKPNYANHLLDNKDYTFEGKFKILYAVYKELKLNALESM